MAGGGRRLRVLRLPHCGRSVHGPSGDGVLRQPSRRKIGGKMTAQHTPGPWIWSEDGLRGEDDDVLTRREYEGMWLTHGPNREANARLIAAAPDLLEAVRLLVYSADAKAYQAGRAAIAKATQSPDDQAQNHD